MKLSIVPNMPENFELVLFGDNQEGNIASAKDKFRECVDYICSKPNRYGIHMGDACDAFWINDKRYDTKTCENPPKEQKKNVIKMLTPLAKTGRLLSMLKGNHEKEIERYYGGFADEMCEELRREGNQPKYPIAGSLVHKIEFINKKNHLMFKGYFAHGRKGIYSVSPDPHRILANKQQRLKKLLEPMAGDCILMVRGHSHIVLVTPPLPALYLATTRGKIRQFYTQPGTGKSDIYIPPEHRFYGCSGSFLKSQMIDVDTYSEAGEMPPTELGYLIAAVEGGNVVDLKEVRI